MRIIILFLAVLGLGIQACGQPSKSNSTTTENIVGKAPKGMKEAYFAQGCFWCSEIVFESVKGVSEVVSGYSGGREDKPSYQEVSAGQTGHAEGIVVYYDPKIIDYNTLLKLFFGSHDPTQVNRQGPDVGRQYRSAIFYSNQDEKMMAEEMIAELNVGGKYSKPIATEVVALEKFWKAEDYHQDYVKYNPENSYVRNVSIPKFLKFKKEYREYLKEGKD